MIEVTIKNHDTGEESNVTGDFVQAIILNDGEDRYEMRAITTGTYPVPDIFRILGEVGGDRVRSLSDNSAVTIKDAMATFIKGFKEGIKDGE